ncbi:reelin domain-containing protein 1 isoform X2 [Electrophorus electricus]|uniref:reelin domain-containing protein 1 isoform X2 n=1 Tax=Electrophorus electricus TaxID=8005 RepID=UPI0015D01C2F|nr:reelin domain-containing protein 1 isoform X2 [Electrophorus electricus]
MTVCMVIHSYGMTRFISGYWIMRVMVMKAVLLACVWVSGGPTRCVCFSHGASSDSCEEMKPGHIGAHLQYTHTPSTVTIHASRAVYLPLHILMVSVRSSRAFMGLLLQARSVPEDHVVGGEFTLLPPGTHTLSCLSTGDTVTHSDKLLKRNLSFTWRAPSRPSGDLRFYITVVYSYFVYGARIRSSVVHDGLRSIQGVGYGSALPTRIMSAFFTKSTDMQIHTSVLNTQHLNNTTPTLLNNFLTHTLPPQHRHTPPRRNRSSDTQPYTNAFTHDRSHSTYNPRNTTAETFNVTNRTIHTKNNTQLLLTTQTETSPTVYLHTTTSTSAPQTQLRVHTSSKTLLHRHTPTHAGLHKHTHIHPFPNTMPDKHLPPTRHAAMHTGPQTHIHVGTLNHSAAGTRLSGKTHTFSHFRAGSAGLSPEPLNADPSPTSPRPQSSSVTHPPPTEPGVITSNPGPPTLLSTHSGPQAPLKNHMSTPDTHSAIAHVHTSATHTRRTPYNTEIATVSHIQAGQTPPAGTTPTTPLTTHSQSDRTSVLTAHTTHSLQHELLSDLSSTCTHTPTVCPPTMAPTAPTHTPTPSTPRSDRSPALLRSHSDPLLPVNDPDRRSQREGDSTGHNPPQHPREPSGAPDREGAKPDRVPRQIAPELGLLLGLSAALGMAVAVGLRYLQRKHCRKRTAVSLGDCNHDNRGIIHVQECGDLVQVRRIRENSFLLLQTEYNLISAPGN